LLHLADEAMYLVKNTKARQRRRGEYRNFAGSGGERRIGRLILSFF